MGSDMRFDSLAPREQRTSPPGEETDAALERAGVPAPEGAAHRANALPLLLILLLVLLSPLLYDLGRWLRAR